MSSGSLKLPSPDNGLGGTTNFGLPTAPTSLPSAASPLDMLSCVEISMLTTAAGAPVLVFAACGVVASSSITPSLLFSV
eukprot:CAMPEP_0114163874 /NCGR_PEP_ID=MMETSP0043_2-20121206/30331_1 /TAXON_ID=464988 /ORGANISM="Hemiselmis andersenii, Strain CCMP644" /LENGTH=78 /DNA_ID=CAMNT_0001260425 /DNA_START=206 /DNA_END=439 /DNA_ORIENTATION=+